MLDELLVSFPQDPMLDPTSLIEPINPKKKKQRSAFYMNDKEKEKGKTDAISSASLPILPTPCLYSPSNRACIAANFPNAGVTLFNTQAVNA